jgi:excisionase family DNA binding protein
MDSSFELLTMTEAARVLRVETSTIREWRLRGKFPFLFCKIAGRVLVHRRDLEALIEQGKNRLTVTAQRNLCPQGSTTKTTGGSR